jgi:hypothetical protein
MGAIFTVVSIARSYCLRRLFERIRARAECSNAAGQRCLGGAATGLFKPRLSGWLTFAYSLLPLWLLS